MILYFQQYYQTNFCITKAYFVKWFMMLVHDYYVDVEQIDYGVKKCKLVQEQAYYYLFQSNLWRSLLAPPFPLSDILLALDPGFKAGIKCAILNKNKFSDVHTLKTIQYIGHTLRSTALKELGSLIEVSQQLMMSSKENKGMNDTNGGFSEVVVIALGNWHGTYFLTPHGTNERSG